LKILFMTPGKFLDACSHLYIKVVRLLVRLGCSPFYPYMCQKVCLTTCESEVTDN
jgi:hypothetical protein